MATDRKSGFWISYADMMTFLMLIFLFISISFIKSVRDKQKKDEKIVKEFQETQVQLLKELQSLFKKEFASDSSIFRLDSANLSIRFVNEDVLFDYNQSELKPRFKEILNDFIPKFFNIILKQEYHDKIAEIRIEGHTDSKGDYLYNLKLSQERARSVLTYVRNNFYEKYNDNQKKILDFWITANGYSYGRTLDKNNHLTYLSKLTPDDEKSRRVEFRIVTSTDSLYKELLRRIK